jgi:hypothetical protein
MKRMKELEDEHRRQKKRYLVERLVSVIRKEALGQANSATRDGGDSVS